MPLQIDMVDRAEVQLSPNGELHLPAVVLRPTESSVILEPLQTHVQITSPGQLERKVVDAVTAALTNAYLWPHEQGYPVTFDSPVTLAVGRAARLPDLDQPLTVEITLSVLHARRSWFGKGERQLASGRSTWVLQPARQQPRVPQPPPAPVPPCLIELDPSVLYLQDSGRPARLHIKITNRPADQAPALVLGEQLGNCPNLLTELTQLFQTRAQRQSLPDQDLWVVDLSLNLTAKPQASQELLALTRFETLRLLGHVQVGNAPRAPFYLHLGARVSEFPGVVAIDLGTSSSTVTLFNGNVIPEVRSLPPEQQERLQRLVQQRVVDENGRCLIEGITPAEWDTLLRSLDLAGSGTITQRLRHATEGGVEQLLEALRQLEVHATALPLRRRLRAVLQEIYEAAFLEPRLHSHSLYWAALDGRQPRRKDLLSELQIVTNEDPLAVQMGAAAHEARLEALAHATGGGAEAKLTLEDLRLQFHACPKRYLGSGQIFSGRIKGQPVQVPARKIVQAAWNHLVERTNQWRENNSTIPAGLFTRMVVTYPTVATPAIRREVQQLVKELGFPQVITDYDEAVAAAFFYFHRELGGDINLGAELFKARAQQSNGAWFQNVLVLDIGGGSTDIALIRLTLEERMPFAPDEDRGAGGRYYVVTPRLEGSSGNTHLGGTLITLRVYEMLKAALADRLLEAVQSGELVSMKLTRQIALLDAAFKDEEGRFRAGSLALPVATHPEGSESRLAALQAANEVLPTRWLEQPRQSVAFFALWEHAENAKVGALGRGVDATLPAAEIQQLLPAFGVTDVAGPVPFDVVLSRAHFEQAAREIVREAIKIAEGLIRDRLPKSDGGKKSEKLDWLILSGKTWNMPLAYDVLRQEFRRSEQFIWNPDRVTFEPEYAKLATSAGACYAELLRKIVLSPDGAKSLLRAGRSQLEPRVANLFWFLPCSFLLFVINGEEEIFRAGQELYQLDNDPVGKARSAVQGTQRLVIVLRRDFVGAKPIAWNSFGGEELATEVGMTAEAFTRRIWMQFEVDHRLLMRLYLWQSDTKELPRHFALDPDAPALTLKAVRPPQADGARKAGVDITVGAESNLPGVQPPESLIKADQALDLTFHLGAETVQGTVVERLPQVFSADGRLTVYTRLPGQREWTREGELERPGQGTESQFQGWYQLSLDDTGRVRLHRGRVPYWTTTNRQQWVQNPGQVLSCELDPVGAVPPPGRDPFDGTH